MRSEMEPAPEPADDPEPPAAVTFQRFARAFERVLLARRDGDAPDWIGAADAAQGPGPLHGPSSAPSSG